MYVIIPDAFINMWLIYSLSTTKHSNAADSRVKADKFIVVSTRCVSLCNVNLACTEKSDIFLSFRYS